MVIQIVSMDALVWNTLTGIGRKAALGEANSTGHSSAKFVPSELGLRRQQASAPASASAQQSPAETKLKACKNPNSSLVISPLLPPPSPFPVPLKFLWFNKTGEVGVGTDTKPELDTKEQFNCNCEAVKTFEQIEESFTEDGGEESTRITALDNPDDSLESSAEQTPPKLNSPAAKECTPPGNNAQHSQDRGDANYISPNNENNPEKSDQVSYNNWVERIMEFRSYWKEQRKCDPNSSSNGSASSTEVEPCLAPQVDCSCEMHASNIDHGICCNGDEFLCYCSLMKQEPISMNDRDSFSGLLRPVPFPETKFYVQMSFLCARAYAIPKIKPRELWKLYGLRFVTSSLHNKSESTAEVTANAELQSTSISSEIGGVVDSRGNDETNPRLFVNPSVAYEIAASAASYIHSQTKYILPFKSESSNQADNDENLSIKTKQRATVDKNNQMNIETEKEAEVAVADQRAPDTDNQQTQAESSKLSGMFKSEMATVVANSSVTALVATEEDAKQGAAKDLQSLHSSPCGWFICDDDSSHTRYFVIQGSDSLASWQANLFFEPTQFENFEVLVHRGIYEAARGMYEQLLPEILSHLGKHGENARFRFTGHSLGGSLSLLVNLMLLIRGVVSITSLLPVITFGSPCIMCGGDYLLQKLGLPNSHVQAVMMHRDIVPRAFACEYPVHVSEFLKRLNVSFRNHPCLSFQNVLYGSMGQLLILQPDEKLSPPHPLLPSGSGFYILHHAAQDMIEHENELSDTLKVRAAQSAFLNTPHPLEILSDRCAYGSEGSISRDHDASNYLNVINYILRQQIKHLRKLQRKQRKQIWWPLVTADSSMPSHRPSQVATKESKMSKDLRRMCR